MQILVMPFIEMYPALLLPVTYLQMRLGHVVTAEPWVLSRDFQCRIQATSRILAGKLTSQLIMYRFCFRFSKFC